MFETLHFFCHPFCGTTAQLGPRAPHRWVF